MTAVRQLRRAPAISIAAIVTLAVAIGAATAVFSFVAGVMGAASPAPDMDRLVALWSHRRGEAETKGLTSPADYLQWETRVRSFAVMAAWRAASFNVSGISAPVRASAQLVTPDYFDLYGWRPAIGRGFLPDDAAPGAARVVVLSHAYWQTRLGGRADILGQMLKLDGEPATIIGVLPSIPSVTGVFVPLSLAGERDDRHARTLFVFARLRTGVSLDAASREMEEVAAALEREFPATGGGWTVNTRPLQEEFIGPQARTVFALLVAGVIVVLVIGCVNVANLLLARGVARRGELALRLALGAGAWRLVRQLLAESAVLALSGGVLSLVVSRWTLTVLRTLGDVDSPWLASEGLNLRVLAMTAVVSMAATMLAGLMPALAARRTALIPNLQGTGRSTVRGRRALTRLLVSAQVALAVAMLVVAGLAARTLNALENRPLGFELDNVLTASVTLPDAVTAQAAGQWIHQALAEVRRLPGVLSAGATSRLPFAGTRWNPNRGLEIEGDTAFGRDEGLWAIDYVITPGLLESLRVPLIEGRSVSDADGAGAPLVALVNQTMARRYWPNRSPVGARLRQGDEPVGQWRTVIGVVGDVRNDDADQAPAPYLYVAAAQRPQRAMTFALRTAADPAGAAPALRAAIASFDPDQALYDVRTMRAVWEADLQGSRLLIRVMAALAALAVGLAGLGVWGVTAQAVAQRTREIGVRIALGATTSQVVALIARQGLVPIAIGLTAGLAAGLGLGQVMRSLLFDVTPTDPLTIAATLGVLAAVGLLATIGPAQRAARLDPLTALRDD
jgi:putative ABC transport system permease protein